MELNRPRRGLFDMLFSEDDKVWIKKNYPKLLVTVSEASGVIDILATYNLQEGVFLDVAKTSDDPVGGVRLSGTFSLTITERLPLERMFSNLPKVVIEDISPDPERHINLDNSACLCSPLEEDIYLLPTFQTERFFKDLLIPFLYGQIFFSSFKRWPWTDYGHGSIGILESYDHLSESSHAESCLGKLQSYKHTSESSWSEIRRLLTQRGQVKGHSMCICKNKDQIRRCHPRVWHGLRKLQTDIRNQNIAIPE